MSSLRELKKEVQKNADPKRAVVLRRFFQTGKGEYGHGDEFAGLTVPQSRLIAKKYHDLPHFDIAELLQSKVHEQRLIALLVLIENFRSGDAAAQKKIVDFYLQHTACVNNWDLVDVSADKIVGAYLFARPRAVLFQLARSSSLWERRIAIVATQYFIRENQFDDTLAIAGLLLNDPHDLIHKAVGWMLREVGKRDQKTLEQFLNQYASVMPRTMLRSAIERFPQAKRQRYLRREH